MDKKQEIKTPQETLAQNGNVIKARDDRDLILIDKEGQVINQEKCSWLPNDGDVVDNNIFRSRIEPWLTSLFQSEHLSLLCGSGITNAISYLAGASTSTTMEGMIFSKVPKRLLNSTASTFTSVATI